MALQVILSFVPTIVDHTISPIIRHISYPFKCKINVEKRDRKIEKLKATREKVQHLVDEDKRNGKLIEREVQEWLCKVDGFTEKVSREQIEDKERVKCFVGFCPNFKFRYVLSKKAEKQASYISRLQTESEFGIVSYRSTPRWTFISGYEALQSRLVLVKKIVDALTVADLNMVGVYGMGGVGKTTLVKHVAKQAMEDKLFDAVVIAMVTQTLDTMKIQGQIADMLGLKFDEESEAGRAGRLRERLKQEKKILVVLDDLWKSLDLEAIGIPSKYDHNGCKILLTSRDLDILTTMDSQKNFAVGVLSEQEAWDLFKNMAGDIFENHGVQSTAIEVAKECAGLPVAIVTVARALKTKSLSEWKNALGELKRPSPSNFLGVQKEVYAAIELSYNHLASEELKSIFLLCSRMGYNASIGDLLKYGVGLDLFDVDRIEQARDKVHSLVQKLKASCLLLDGGTSKQFAMHDVVRDVAISVAFRDHNVFVKSDGVELRWRDKDALRKCSEIWLHGNNIQLPDKLEYPQLEFFHMNVEDPSMQIPDNIFAGMQILKVLALTNLSFSSSLSSLHLPKNLHSLCLHQSLLGDITAIGELKQLEILSFVKSSIKHLPREIGQLTKLKLLDLSDCLELEAISPNAISNLSQLEELFMGNSFHSWDPKGQDNASVGELEHLSHLTSLDIHVPDSAVMSKYMFPKRLKKYRIFIGDVWDWNDLYEDLRTLKLKLNASAGPLENGLLMLLKRTEGLYLSQLKGVKNIIYELDSDGFAQLKLLQLHNSHEIQNIIDTMEGVPSNNPLFPALESLIVCNLSSLEKICHGAPKAESFSKLRILEVEKCSKLKNLFSFSMAQGLVLLQRIKLAICLNMEEIIAEESEEIGNKMNNANAGIQFAQLRFLSLQYLPQLRSFCSMVKTSCLLQKQSKPLATVSASDEILLEDEQRTPKQLFSEKILFPNLEDVELQSLNVERLWYGQLPEVAFPVQNLKRLDVHDCGNLKYLFSSFMVKSLVQLEELTVEYCMSLEEIVVTEGVKEETMSKMLFPKLYTISLISLPKLQQFCTGYLIECPLLEQLNIGDCPELKAFISNFTSSDRAVNNESQDGQSGATCHDVGQPFFDEKVAFPSLAEMCFWNMHNLERMWHSKLEPSSFSKLRYISIVACEKLVSIFPSILLERLRRLEVLCIKSCGMLEVIFELQGLIVEETKVFDAPFQLRKLTLDSLVKLKNIWNKDSQGILNFQNLCKVRVSKCNVLKNVFPFSVAKDLLRLEKLQINDCGVKEIVAKAEDGEAAPGEAAPCFVFPRLTSFKLKENPEFRNFYLGKHTWECPMLKSLAVHDCGNTKLFTSKFHNLQEIQWKNQLDASIQQPLFVTEKVISNLEELSLDGRDSSSTSIMCHCQPPADSLTMLKVLKLRHFKTKSDSIPFGLLRRLRNLESLFVKYTSFKKLFLHEGYVDEEEDIGTPGQLKNLAINSVYDTRHIWHNHQLVLLLSNLSTMRVVNCDSLVNLAPSSASFQNLTTLDIGGCNRLVHLITSSTAKTLVQLIKLTISYCDTVREIVVKEGDQRADEIVFSKLECLKLVNLKSLTSFSQGNHTFKFPSLKKMVVERCPTMSIFSPGALSTPKLQEVCWERYPKNKICWQGNLNATIQQLHSEMVGLNGLLILKLSDFPQLKETWRVEPPVNYFSQLSILTVEECEFVADAIPSKLLQFMNNLECLSVKNCDSLEGVFDLVGLNMKWGHTLVLPNLYKLELTDLPRLRHIWNKDPQGILDFGNLKFLQIENCSNLRNIFTPSMAMGLVQLQAITIRSCAIMEEIIKKERGEKAATHIIFPVLQTIVLESLRNLTCIYSGSGILEIPSLKRITIENCPHMKTFAASFLMEQEPDSMNEAKPQRPSKGGHNIFTASSPSCKVLFPNMNEVRVDWTAIMEVIQHGQFQAEYFCKLEVLGLVHFPNDYVDFPSHFLQRFTDLKKLVVRDASFKEIILHEETNDGEKATGFLPLLREIELSKLQKLMHLSKGDSRSSQIFQNLETLEVSECGILKILIPSALTFQCLMTLEVSKCHGLTDLMTSSAAKYLVRLTRMSITDCKTLEQIVVNEENEVENEVIFHKLVHLRLHCLPSLTSFHMGNCSFMFPSLEEVLVKECPKMKIFSQGVIRTPELDRVRSMEEDNEGNWKDDLNSTINMLFMEMGDGAAQSNLPSLPKETTHADRNGPNTVSERQGSEDLHSTGTSNTIMDVPEVETIFGAQENRIKDVLIEPKIIQLASRYQDFNAASNDKDLTQVQNFSYTMDSEAQISARVEKVPQATDSNEPSQDLVMPTYSIQVNSSVSHDTVVEQVPTSSSAILNMTVSSKEFTCIASKQASRTSSIPFIAECHSYVKSEPFVMENSNPSKDPPHDVGNTTKNEIEPQESLTQAQNSPNPINFETQISLQVQKVPKGTDKELRFGTASPSSSEIPSIPSIDNADHLAANVECLFASMERLINISPTSSSQLASSSTTHMESRESGGVSFETYSYSLALIKKLLKKSPAEVAISADRLLLLSCLKNLRNCLFLSSQQLELIQLYIENFNTLVTSHPFYEQKVGWTRAIKFSIEDEKREIAELKTSYEDLISKTGTLNAEKEALKKRFCEIEEEEDRIRANMKGLRDQLVAKKGKLETHTNALLEAEKEQREAEDIASNVGDYWGKLRMLFG